MIVYKFKVPIYKWSVLLVQIENKKDIEPLKRLLRANRFKEEDELYKEITDKTETDCVDGGITIRDRGRKELFVVLYRMTNAFELANIYSHEKRHVEDEILEYCDVNGSEASAYLAGYIGMEFYKFYLKVKPHFKFL